MTSGENDGLPIIQLFCSELKKQVDSLKKALEELKNQGPNADLVDSLVRIAHSIKGAAKLINIKPIAMLSDALESVFKKISAKTFSETFRFDEVERGVDLFEELSIQDVDKIMTFSKDKENEIESIIQGILKVDEVKVESSDENKSKNTVALNPRSESKNVDLVQYISQVRQESEELNSLLKEIDTDFSDRKVLERLVDISIRMKKSVIQVDFPVVIELCKALESCFSAASNNHLVWTQGHMDLILEAADFITRFGALEGDEVEAWLSKYGRSIESIGCVLSAISRESNITPKAKPQEKIVKQDSDEKAIENNQEKYPQEEELKESDGDAVMLDLFSSELEQRIKELNNGLLSLESNSTESSLIEPLMRAAHSLKGAARIVDFSLIARLAHVMEDYFSALQKGEITVNGESIDTIFGAVDLLTRLNQVSHEFMSRWISNNAPEIENSIKAISLLAEDKIEMDNELSDVETHAYVTKEIKKEPKKNQVKKYIDNGEKKRTQEDVHGQPYSKPLKSDPYLRVSSSSLNRLMGLAGESLVESRWLAPFSDSLQQLKRLHGLLNKDLNALEEGVHQRDENQELDTLLQSLKQGVNECRSNLNDRINDLELFMQRYSSLSDRLYAEAINSRMRPIADGIEAFPRFVRDLARQLKKQVKLDVKGSNTPVDREILDKLEAPLNHLLRNAIDHGIELPEERRKAGKNEEGTIIIEASHLAGMLSITVSDDGRGVNIEELRHRIIDKGFANSALAEKLNESELLEFMFLPGFSSSTKVTEISGRGIGLNVVQTMVQDVGGSIKATINGGLSFHMQLPLTLSVIRALMVEISGESYAIPLAHLSHVLLIPRQNIQHVENRQYFHDGNKNIGLISAYQCLELPNPTSTPLILPVLVLKDHMNHYGVVVDKFIGEKELVVQELDPMLGKVPDIYGGALMEDGSPVLIIDVEDLIRSIDKLLSKEPLDKLQLTGQAARSLVRKKILVVDDSVTVREVQCRLLQKKGYEVDTAINGIDGWNAVRLSNYDLVITDVDMPRMNGIEFVKAMKSDPKLERTPVMIVSYKEREEDKVKGLEAGANYYLTKSSFHDETLIEAVKNLIGEK